MRTAVCCLPRPGGTKAVSEPAKLSADEALEGLRRWFGDRANPCVATISSELAALRLRVKELEAKRFHTGAQIMREFECPTSPVATPQHEPWKSKP